MPERFRVVCIPCKALYKCSSLPLIVSHVCIRPTLLAPTLDTIRISSRVCVCVCVCVCVLGVHLSSSSGAATFSRRHPLASWVGSMLLCFAGELLNALLAGEAIITSVDGNHLFTATLVWSVNDTCRSAVPPPTSHNPSAFCRFWH